MEKATKKSNARKQIIITVFCMAVTIGLVGVFLSSRNELNAAITYLQTADLTFLILLVPVIFLMYYSAGRIWYPYLREEGLKAGTLGRIQYELNFVNTVLPFYNLPSFTYDVARLQALGVSKLKSGALYVFRYFITIATKWVEIAIALILLIVLGQTGEMSNWAVGITALLTIAILAGLSIVVVLFIKNIRIPKILLSSARFGRVAQLAQKKLDDVFRTLKLAFGDMRAFIAAFSWGMLYSLLEVLPFLVVALAMGHAELFLPIVVAAGVAITVGVLIPTPMGIGGFDGIMIGFLGSMGPGIALASAIVLTTRILVLAGTALTGIPFWIWGMHEMNR